MNNNYMSNLDLDFMTSQFDSLYDEFKMIKNSIRKLDENIKKSLDYHKTTINDFENIILNKINNLISNKLYNHEIYDFQKNIKLKKNIYGNWNILWDDC
jgi:hypothetical protein